MGRDRRGSQACCSYSHVPSLTRIIMYEFVDEGSNSWI